VNLWVSDVQIDVFANRQARKWSRKEQIGRVAWALAGPLFRFSPRPFWAWRSFLLRFFGASIARDVHIYPNVQIEIPWNLEIGASAAVGARAILYSLGLIRIGPRATISQGAHLCAGTHDWRDPAMPLLKPPIEIGADAWICADAFVGPGVTIGDASIIGARAVVMRDVAPATIVAGNPAREIGKREV
jgi:putative colanic acid biosynthesis acetyltransferase WcaF